MQKKSALQTLDGAVDIEMGTCLRWAVSSSLASTQRIGVSLAGVYRLHETLEDIGSVL